MGSYSFNESILSSHVSDNSTDCTLILRIGPRKCWGVADGIIAKYFDDYIGHEIAKKIGMLVPEFWSM